jgi:hypothetical protein
MLIDLGPFSREPIPEQDIERAGELAVERGWEDMGGVQAELAEAKDAWDEWYEIAALRLRRAEAAEQTIQQLRAALLDAEAQLTQGSGSPECHYALGIIRAALTTDTTEPSGD